MNEADVIRATRAHLERQFPKTCSGCGRVFRSLKEYLLNTSHVGAPISYDADEGNYQPVAPVGTISLANCSCGSTLALGSDGMSLLTVWRLMGWARREMKRRQVDMREVLERLRQQVDEVVLSEPDVVSPEPGRT
ncbi:MAG: hypothetical protein U0235_33935 [Polyangiaceae bacterium]